MSFRSFCVLFWVSLAILFSSNAFAKEVELTTYYPAPSGEYSSVQSTQNLTVPVVAAGTKTAANTAAGEIWFER